jgi:uncharacterized protein (TIGR03790 family)
MSTISFRPDLLNRRECLRVQPWCLLAALLTLPASLSAQTVANVALIINEGSAASRQVGEHYITRRDVPASNVIRINTSTDENISREAYRRTIESPIETALKKNALQDRVLYIVLTTGVPLRIQGTTGVDGTTSSVDSELTLLYRRMLGNDVPVRGRVTNPYFQGVAMGKNVERFVRRVHDIYLVTRLDGFTVDDAIALIDRAQQARGDGRFVLDQRGSIVKNPAGDVWLSLAGQRLNEMGLAKRVVLENTSQPARGVDNVLGYYSWGAADPQNRVRQSTMRFAPGALVAAFGSGEARTFKEPPADWTPTGDWQNRASWFEGAPEILLGDLIREGATGAAGHVSDPFLQSAVRPDVLFPAYASGLNLAEAFYAASPHLSWQTVIIGDPLCAPFSRAPLSATDIEEAVDTETQLPGIFARRRIDVLKRGWRDVPPRVLTLSVLADTLLVRGDSAGARKALEEAISLAPTAIAPQLQLALVFNQEKDYVHAAERYEAILKLQPRNPIALNNLAYTLAVHQKDPARAKPFAERALSVAPFDPIIADTLAWTEYLLGNHAVAVRLITIATRGAPGDADVRLHAAFIHAAAQNPLVAVDELKIALDLNPEFRKRKDVQDLETQLAKSRVPTAGAP